MRSAQLLVPEKKSKQKLVLCDNAMAFKAKTVSYLNEQSVHILNHALDSPGLFQCYI